MSQSSSKVRVFLGDAIRGLTGGSTLAGIAAISSLVMIPAMARPRIKRTYKARTVKALAKFEPVARQQQKAWDAYMSYLDSLSMDQRIAVVTKARGKLPWEIASV